MYIIIFDVITNIGHTLYHKSFDFCMDKHALFTEQKYASVAFTT